ncbi:MAG: hypothetical protein RLZZ142_2025 [Verrucomicrobiota bacterium]
MVGEMECWSFEKAVTTRIDETCYSALPLSYGPEESGKVGPEGLLQRKLLFRPDHGKRLESRLGPEERGGLVCSSHDQAAGDGLDVSGHW